MRADAIIAFNIFRLSFRQFDRKQKSLLKNLFTFLHLFRERFSIVTLCKASKGHDFIQTSCSSVSQDVGASTYKIKTKWRQGVA
jgi:hypothetical protein